MALTKRSLSTALVAVLAASGLTLASAATALAPAPLTREVVIGYEEEGLSSTISVILELGGRVERITTATKTLSATVPVTLTDADLGRLTLARYVAEPVVYSPLATPAPADPFFARQWGLQSIHAPQAWQINDNASGIVVAIIDSGVEMSHPDLAANLWNGPGGIHGHNIVGNNSDVTDNCGHGTIVAGVLGAVYDNLEGIAGTAKTSLMIVKTADSSTGCSSNSTTLHDGIVWAADNGANILSMSLGSGVTSDPLVDDALAYAASKGVLMVAAAGNANASAVLYPARSPFVIAVSGLQRSVPDAISSVADPGLPQDALDERWASSNFGPEIEIAAPAADIFTTLTTNDSSMGIRYGYVSGTSLAVPFVAGAAALAWALDPSMTASTLRSKINSTAMDMGDPGLDPKFGHGKLDAQALLASV